MSCEIKRLANVADLQHVKEYFGFSGDENWLNAVYHSVSPTAEVLAIAHGAKMVLMSTRWDNELQNHKYSVTWKGDLVNPNDIVTSIICLPIVGASSSSAADWTCIAVGLATGIVQFYTDFGLEIYAQQWHNEPLQCIRAQSGRKITEELHLMYGTCVCIVQGTHLFQTLRSMKHHHQRSKASAADDLSQQPEPVPCRKWSYGGKGIVINDASVVGAQKMCAFDHLLTAGMEGGFYAKYKSAPPQNSLIVAVGSKPFVGFHWAKEGFVQPVLADVARAVASKLKSALPTWLMGPQTPAADVPPPPTPAEPMTLRFGLCDLQRTGLSVWVAPGNRLAAVADNLGRVILVDCHRCIAVRVWKGYRDAQCSFIKATEKLASSKSSPAANTNSTDRRHALFLVIFAPRRSCLEIWCLQRGPKVAAFSASKHGQLIYNSHSLMGWNGTSKIKYSANSCMFFDPGDSSLKEITVPFHCALTDSNSKTAKDLHLLRRLKSALKSDDDTLIDANESTRLDDIATLCRGFQTDDIRLQCIEMLVKNNRVKPPVLKVVLDVFQEHTTMDRSASLDMTGTSSAGSLDIAEDVTQLVQHNYFTILLANYSRLVTFYMYVTANDKRLKIDPEDGTADNVSLSEDEVDNLQRLIDLLVLERNSGASGGIHSPKVTFHENVVSNNFVDFLAAFNCSADDGIRAKDDYGQLAAIGQMMFEMFLERGRPLDDWLDMAKESSLLSDDFLRLFLSYWLQKPFLYTKIENLIASLIRFTAILQQICAIDAVKVKCEYGSISSWWQSVREMLLDSASAPMSLLAAMMCRNHAARYRQRENSNDEASSSADDEPCWEQVSQETAQWSLLIGKLDDIAALGAVLNCAKQRDRHEMPLLPHHKPDISLCAIVNGGHGIVSEMMAKWIASLGVAPVILLENIDGVDLNADDAWFVNYLNTLRRHFPFSTQSGRLLCYLAWDYMSVWSKNMTELSYLRAALEYLDTIKEADFALKHGLCCMIWNAHLKIPLEATKKLINKWSHLPKERLCLQDIGLSDSLVPEFLDLCRTFLKLFTYSVDGEKVELRFEELLQDGPVPLTLLALQQTPAQSELLRLHRELTEVLFAIASLGIRYPKPIQSQFDAMSNEAFFTEINRQLTHALPVADMVLQRRRLDFLCTAITSTMDLIREDMDCVYLADHKLWMERLVQMANDWSLDVDQLKKHQIVELYAYGWDDYAEEQLDTVLDTESLGGLLLRIAGRRLNIYTKNSPTGYAQVASIGPLIVDYLDTLHNSNATQIYRTSSDISLDKLIALAGQAFKCLAKKDTKDLRLAGQMFDACAFLKENSITST